MLHCDMGLNVLVVTRAPDSFSGFLARSVTAGCHLPSGPGGLIVSIDVLTARRVGSGLIAQLLGIESSDASPAICAS